MTSRSLSRACPLSLAALLLLACDSPAPKTGADGVGSVAPTSTATANAPSETPPEPTTPAELTEIAISKHYPVVGDKLASTLVQQTKLKLDGKSAKGPVLEETSVAERMEKSEECLAVEGKLCTKLKVTYGKWETKTTQKDGQSEVRSPAHAGKSFTVELKKGALSFSDASGKPPTKAELEALQGDYRDFAREAEWLDALPDRVKVGDSLTALAKVLAAREQAGVDPFESSEFELIVRSIKDGGSKKIVVLDLSLKLAGASASKNQRTITAKGTLELRADLGLAVKREIRSVLAITYGGQGTEKLTGKADGEQTSTAVTSYSF